MRKRQIALGAFLIAALVLLCDIFLQNAGDELRQENEEWEDEHSVVVETLEVLDEEGEISATTIATMSRVVDGDTIVVLVDGEQKIVRLIGLDAPETVDPQQGVGCYGSEASAALKSELLEGDTVTLIADDTQDNHDRYDRLLRYVEEGNQDIGRWLIANGYAEEYAYDGSFAREEVYKVAEEQAREGNLGIWSGACNKPSTSP